MLGMFTGRYVKESPATGERKTLNMLAAAIVMAIVAVVWAHWFPVIKKLWTSTFVLACGAWSIGLFAVFYYLIDVKENHRFLACDRLLLQRIVRHCP